MRGAQYMSSVVETMTRKSLAEMDPGELRQSLLDRRQQLVHRKRFIRGYLHPKRIASVASRAISGLYGTTTFLAPGSPLLFYAIRNC